MKRENAIAELHELRDYLKQLKKNRVTSFAIKLYLDAIDIAIRQISKNIYK